MGSYVSILNKIDHEWHKVPANMGWYGGICKWDCNVESGVVITQSNITWSSLQQWTHWGRVTVTHICIGNLTISGSDNALSPDRQCWKFPQVHRSEADNYGGGPETFCWFFFNFMFMMWHSRHEDLQLFDWVSNTADRHQAIIWTNSGMLLIGPLGTNFSDILSEIHTFSSKKMHLKMSSAKWCPFFLSSNELSDSGNI